MKLPHFAHIWRLKLEQHRSLAKRKAARLKRSEAARKGHSNELRRRAAKCREIFA